MDKLTLDDFLSSFDDSYFPGDFLKTYEPMECLSSNPAGETLLVKHRQTGLYFIAKCYTDPSLLSRVTESELLRKLYHDALPAFISEHQNDEMLCVVREYAKGTPLDKLAKDKPLTEQQVISIGVQLCGILTYLHGQTPPIIHRDIKPQNIIVDEDGKIKLIDFGISRIYDETAQEDTVCFGTKNFAAPEQYGFSQTDSRSDIFSLGVLLGWLLTGEVEVKKAVGGIQNRRLAGIVKKCTAFSPKERYMNAARVKDALIGRNVRRRMFASLCSFVAIATTIFIIFVSGGNLSDQQTIGVTFEESLIEQAVRLALSKNEDEKIMEEELLSLTELYVFGDKAAANEEMYRTYSDSFVANDGTVLRGSIHSLNDVAKLKNIRRLYLAYQNISDLTPLSQLVSLEYIELKHNPIQDVSPLSQLVSLNSLFLFDTNVSDLTILSGCSRLTNIDVGYTQITSMAALDGLDSLQTLIIRRAPLKTLDNVGAHPMLKQIYLSETHLLDLNSLLDLPRLQLVEVSEDMREAAQAIAGEAKFEILYH
ncbi:MAG: protein kinase [Lutispora sp.]|nr:protein kinase [Lutispora sp.]